MNRKDVLERLAVSNAASMLGKLGGPARARVLSPERRREISLLGVQARMAKLKPTYKNEHVFNGKLEDI